MIEYVDRLLTHWAQEFSVRDGGVALGYGSGWSSGAMAADVTERDRRRAVTAHGVASRPTSARSGVGKVAERVNQAVEALPALLQQVVRLHYLDGSALTCAQKADFLHCSLRTFHRYIHSAHEQISASLPDSYVHWCLKYPQGEKS